MSKTSPPTIWERVFRASFSRSKRSLASRWAMDHTCHFGKCHRNRSRRIVVATKVAGSHHDGKFRKGRAIADCQEENFQKPRATASTKTTAIRTRARVFQCLALAASSSSTGLIEVLPAEGNRCEFCQLGGSRRQRGRD